MQRSNQAAIRQPIEIAPQSRSHQRRPVHAAWIELVRIEIQKDSIFLFFAAAGREHVVLLWPAELQRFDLVQPKIADQCGIWPRHASERESNEFAQRAVWADAVEAACGKGSRA